MEIPTRSPRFDDAEGYGRMAVGGRGGKVVYVTNLNDSGSGSLREACTADMGPRTILFQSLWSDSSIRSPPVCNPQFYHHCAANLPLTKESLLQEPLLALLAMTLSLVCLRVRLGVAIHSMAWVSQVVSHSIF